MKAENNQNKGNYNKNNKKNINVSKVDLPQTKMAVHAYRAPSGTDPYGSYTGNVTGYTAGIKGGKVCISIKDGQYAVPEQDADDL